MVLHNEYIGGVTWGFSGRRGTWKNDTAEQSVVESHDKPFFFMEADCPSRTGSAAIPNDWSLPGEPSQEEQSRFYQAMFTHCKA